LIIWMLYLYKINNMNIKTLVFSLLLAVLINIIFIFFGGFDVLQRFISDAPEKNNNIQADIVDIFRFTLEDEVRKKIGMPKEGYEPAMFIKVFPGLVETDFDGVQASLGVYQMHEGTLQYVLDDSKLVHSAAKAITREGYRTLLHNIANRIDIDLSSTGTITDVMRSITF